MNKIQKQWKIKLDLWFDKIHIIGQLALSHISFSTKSLNFYDVYKYNYKESLVTQIQIQRQIQIHKDKFKIRRQLLQELNYWGGGWATAVTGGLGILGNLTSLLVLCQRWNTIQIKIHSQWYHWCCIGVKFHYNITNPNTMASLGLEQNYWNDFFPQVDGFRVPPPPRRPLCCRSRLSPLTCCCLAGNIIIHIIRINNIIEYHYQLHHQQFQNQIRLCMSVSGGHCTLVELW